jgi:hypothetical protein
MEEIITKMSLKINEKVEEMDLNLKHHDDMKNNPFPKKQKPLRSPSETLQLVKSDWNKYVSKTPHYCDNEGSVVIGISFVSLKKNFSH